MAEFTVKCVFCSNALSSTESITVQKGLQTIRDMSVARGDDIASKIENLTEIRVHVKCRKDYTRRLCAPTKALSTVDNVLPSISLRSTASTFDFKRHCLFCGQEDDDDIRKKHPERVPAIHTVATMQIHQSAMDVARERDDEWGKIVLARLHNVIDLIAAEAWYHGVCYQKFNMHRAMPGVSTDETGSRKHVDKFPAFDKLCDYLRENDECQYTLTELVAKLKELSTSDETYSEKQLKRKLLTTFGDDMVITQRQFMKTVVTFRTFAEKTLTEKWYMNRGRNTSDERKRIVEMAARIVREDVRAMAYVCEVYPTSDSVRSGGSELVPETLRLFVAHVVKDGKSGDEITLERKCLNIQQSIIAATRPRSFISPIHLGLSVLLHRRYGSRLLVDMLNKLGVCATYSETLSYESAVVTGSEGVTYDNAYVQFVFDNADYNVRTLDGFGTLHVMGGIKCATPAASVGDELPVARLKADGHPICFDRYARIPIHTLNRPIKSGLQSVTVEDVKECRQGSNTSTIHAHQMDILWLSGPFIKASCRPGWSGFMSVLSRDKGPHDTSAVIPLPFINLDASNPSTIYTSLLFAADECRKQNQEVCMVTYDQPLYIKAMDIVLSEDKSSSLSCVKVRLGGFHLLMSFMGAVGYIMDGSGLQELWETVYAKNSVIHMMTGHAFARALRAHIITRLAVATLVFECCEEDNEFLESMKSLYESALKHDISVDEVIDNPILVKAVNAFDTKVLSISNSSRTGKLWISYIRQVEIMCNFIRAERSGNWSMHLQCVREMLPYLFAAGHFHYARSGLLYLQTMNGLQLSMSSNEYDKFTEQGKFTIRRSDKYWSGIWTDMTIEQVLMRSMKSSGGLTRGRGLSDSTVARWLHSTPASSRIVDAFETFTGIAAVVSEQHVELRDSRQAHDMKDTSTFMTWLQCHCPFDKHPSKLVSLSTGTIGNETINCDDAEHIGLAAMTRCVGKKYNVMPLKRKDRVMPIAIMNKSIRIRGESVIVNSSQLFHRIVCVIKNEADLKACFSYELAPQPPALFDDVSMRKGQKSSLVPVLETYGPSSPSVPENPRYTIDGGHLLHRVVWSRPASFGEICNSYVTYVKHQYGGNVSIVFDGYASPGTKDIEHMRRSAKVSSVDVAVSDNIQCITSQSGFLSNVNNKVAFIALLSEYLHLANITVVQCPGDADRTIVCTALENSTSAMPAVIVGEDTDLLVLIIGLADRNTNIHMLMPANKDRPARVYSSKQLQSSLGSMSDYILFYHAMTGCDTTSAPFRKGKRLNFAKFSKNNDLRKRVDVFNNSESSPDDVASAGEAFLMSMYESSSGATLDEMRYTSYKRHVAKQPTYAKFDLAILPPTSCAAREHSLRVFHQVQAWRGIQLPPTEWGWKVAEEHLIPITSLKAPAPQKLIKLIACNCKSGCERSCQCMQAGFKCNTMCGYCTGHGCSNRVIEDDVEDDDTVLETQADAV